MTRAELDPLRRVFPLTGPHSSPLERPLVFLFAQDTQAVKGFLDLYHSKAVPNPGSEITNLSSLSTSSVLTRLTFLPRLPSQLWIPTTKSLIFPVGLRSWLLSGSTSLHSI